VNLELLIDDIVRQTMVLIAQLATAAGGRTPGLLPASWSHLRVFFPREGVNARSHIRVRLRERSNRIFLNNINSLNHYC
jgi:hypothetical protein